MNDYWLADLGVSTWLCLLTSTFMLHGVHCKIRLIPELPVMNCWLHFFISLFVIVAIYTSYNKERWLFIRIYGCNRNTHGFIHKQQYHVFCMQARHAEKSKGAYFSHLLGVSIGNLPSNLLPLARHYLQERFVICHLYHFSWSVFLPWFSSVLNQFAWDQNNIFYHQVRNYFQNIMICYVYISPMKSG